MAQRLALLSLVMACQVASTWGTDVLVDVTSTSVGSTLSVTSTSGELLVALPRARDYATFLGGITEDYEAQGQISVLGPQQDSWRVAPGDISIVGPDPWPVYDAINVSDGETMLTFSGFNTAFADLQATNKLFFTRIKYEGDEPWVETEEKVVPGFVPPRLMEGAGAWSYPPGWGFRWCGGYSREGQQWDYDNRCWGYDGTTDSFYPGPSLPYKMAGHQMLHLDGMRYLVIGSGPNTPFEIITSVVCDFEAVTCFQARNLGDVPRGSWGHRIEEIDLSIPGQKAFIWIGGNDWEDMSFRQSIRTFTVDDLTLDLEWNRHDLGLEISKPVVTEFPGSQKSAGTTDLLVFGDAESWTTPG